MKNNGNKYLTQHTLSNIAVVMVGVLLYMALSNFTTIRGTLGWLLGIISPFVIGLGIAYLLNMPIVFFQTKIYKRLKFKNVLSIFTVYFIFILLIIFLVVSLLPQLMDSVFSLLRNVPVYQANLNTFLTALSTKYDATSGILDLVMGSYEDVVNTTLDIVRKALPNLINWTVRIGTGIISAFTAIIASIYFLGSKNKLLAQCKKVLYAILNKARADEVIRISRLSNKMFSGFISGKILDSAIIGCICFVFMWVMNTWFIPMPFALLISVIIGVFNIIPFFGPFIGAIPSTMILLLVNPISAFWFVIFIIVLQQFDGNYLGPKILGDSTGLPALWVLIAIIVGGGLFGFIGMVLGVPTVAVLYTLFSEFISRKLKQKNIDAEGNLLISEDSTPSSQTDSEPSKLEN